MASLVKFVRQWYFNKLTSRCVRRGVARRPHGLASPFSHPHPIPPNHSLASVGLTYHDAIAETNDVHAIAVSRLTEEQQVSISRSPRGV